MLVESCLSEAGAEQFPLCISLFDHPLTPCSSLMHEQKLMSWWLQVQKRDGRKAALNVSRPVKKITSPVDAYLDDRGGRKVLAAC